MLSIDTFDEWAPILYKWAYENLSPHFHFSDDWINQSSEKNEWVSVLLWVLGAAKTTLCAKTEIHPHIPESHRVSHMDLKLFAFVVGFSHQRTRQI